jgi:hypothetical protein
VYNLIVSANENEYEGEPILFDLSRCIREYTDTDIKEKYSNLSEENINDIRRMPTIFAYEMFTRKEPKFGLIRGIVQRQMRVQISYEIFKIENIISPEQLEQYSFELDISGWELNRTHWAIKNVDLPKELGMKNIRLPDWVRNETKHVDITKHNFEVALSFPGEHRKYVESIAKELERLIGPNSYFYDKNYTAQLARPSLDLLLQDIYKNRSKLVVIFICSKYQEKDWCGVEFRAIREIIKNRKDKKVMLIKLDDGTVDGINETDGYVDAHAYSATQIAEFIIERINLIGDDI